MYITFEEVAVLEHAKHVARTIVARAMQHDPHGTLTSLDVAMATAVDSILDGATALETLSWPVEEQRRFWGALGTGAGEAR